MVDLLRGVKKAVDNRFRSPQGRTWFTFHEHRIPVKKQLGVLALQVCLVGISIRAGTMAACRKVQLLLECFRQGQELEKLARGRFEFSPRHHRRDRCEITLVQAEIELIRIEKHDGVLFDRSGWYRIPGPVRQCPSPPCGTGRDGEPGHPVALP